MSLFKLLLYNLQKFKTYKKENPLQSKSASIFSEKHYQVILSLETNNIEEVQDKAYMALTTWTGMRLKEFIILNQKMYYFVLLLKTYIFGDRHS